MKHKTHFMYSLANTSIQAKKEGTREQVEFFSVLLARRVLTGETRSETVRDCALQLRTKKSNT